MARRSRKSQDASSDEDAPEIVSHSTSKADAKRSQKALHDFEAEERVRKKARNRERDQKLKERARVTKGGNGRTGRKMKSVTFAGPGLEDEDDRVDDVEARMLRAMREAADEGGSSEWADDDELGHLSKEMDLGDDMASDLESFSAQGQGGDATGPSSGEDDLIDLEALSDSQEMYEDDEEDEATPIGLNPERPNKKSRYLADDLFAAAFASQGSNSVQKNDTKPTAQRQAIKKQRRKSVTRPKDLVMGGRTIRTLPPLSDPRSQTTARSIPSAHARKFIDQSLAMKGKQALRKAKKRGWERQPVNVGVMKYQGAPHGFVRNPR